MPLRSQLDGLLAAAVLLLAGQCIALRSKFYRRETAPHPISRYESLDGLRGFLAIGVFLHHAVVNFYFLRTGEWSHPWSKIYNLLGQTAVVFFFLITGFLFWSKAIAASPSVRMFQLYRGRFMRIAPMYFASSAAIVLIILARTGFPPPQAWGGFFHNLSFMLPMGLANWKPLNGIDPGQVNGYVAWTLGYEWQFYLALPLLAFCARPPRRFIVIVLGFAAFIAYRVLNSPGPVMVGGAASFYFPFLLGAAIAHSVAAKGPIHLLAGPWGSVIFIASIILLPVYYYNGYLTGAYLLAAAAFLPAVHGNSVFGLLKFRGVKMLGAASYSIYLTHVTIIRCTSPLLRPFVHATDPGIRAWSMISVQGLIILAICAMTYRFIEFPFIQLERRWRRNPECRAVAPVAVA